MALVFDPLSGGGTGGGGTFSAGMSTLGNTAGDTGLVNGRLVIVGGSNISLSQSINGQSATLTIDGGAAAAGLTNIKVSAGLVSDLRSDLTFDNSNGVSFGLTNGIITGTVKTAYVGLNTAQTNVTWTVNSSGISLNAGGYAGTNGAITGGSITVNTSGVSVNLPAYLTTARASTDAIGLNTAQTNVTWTVNSSGLSLNASGYAGTGFTGTNATGTAATNGISVSVAAPIPIATAVNPVASANSTGTVTRYAPEDHRHAGIGAVGMSTSGNTAGTTGSEQGTYWFQGGNNVTLSQITSNNGSHTLVISGGNFRASTDAVGLNTAQTNVTWTVNSSGISLNAGGYAGTNTAATNATVTLNTSGISVSVAAPIPIATAVNAVASANSTGTVTRYAPEDHKHAGIGAVGISTSGNTAGTTGSEVGTYWFQGGNNITLSQITSNNGSHTLVISGGNFRASTDAIGLNTAQTNVTWTVNSSGISLNAGGYAGTNTAATGASVTLNTSGISVNVTQSTQYLAMTLGGNTAGTTTFHASNNASLFFNGGNNITLSGSGSTVTISAAAQSNQTMGLYMSSNTTSSVSSGTVNATAMTFRGVGIASVGYSGGEVIISVPAGGGGITAVNVSAGTTSNNLSALTFADSNGISFGINASTITASANTVGTATTYYPVASANSVGTVTRWAAEDHRHAGIGGLGISTAGNSSGTSGSQVGTYWLQGGSNITISQITSNNGSHTAIISGPTPATMSMWPYPLPASTAVSTYYSGSTSQGAGGGSTQTGYTFSLYAVPMDLPAAVAFSELRIGVSNTRSTAGTGSVTHLLSIGLYTNNASTLSLVKGYYAGLGLTQNSVTAQTFRLFTMSTGSNSVAASGGYGGLRSDGTVYSSQGNISANSQMDGVPGVKFMRVDNGAATTFPANQYYCVMGFASASASVNVYANVGILQSNVISSNNIPDLGRENSTQTSNYLPAWGAISTTFTSVSNAANWFPLPNAIAISDMTMSNSSGQRFHFPYMRNHS